MSDTRRVSDAAFDPLRTCSSAAIPPTGSRSCRSRTTCTVPPCASVLCTARSTPFSRLTIVVPSSGQLPSVVCARPHFGHSYAGRSTPSWTRSNSTRPSEAASSVCSQPAAARPFFPASSRQRASSASSRLRHHSSSTGRTASSSCVPVGMRFRRRPACEAVSSVLRQQLLELGADVVCADEHDRHAAQPPHARVERVGDLAQMLLDDVLDVPLVPTPATSRPGRGGRERPSLSSAISTRAPPRSRNTSPRSRPTAATSAPSRPTCGVSGARYSSFAILTLVGNAVRKRKRAPEVVEGRREHGDATHAALAVEAVVEPLPDPVEIGLQPLPLVVGRGGLPLVREPLRFGELGVDPRLDAGRGRCLARVEIHVEADRAAIFGAERRQLPQLFPGDPRHDSPFLAPGARS